MWISTDDNRAKLIAGIKAYEDLSAELGRQALAGASFEERQEHVNATLPSVMAALSPLGRESFTEWANAVQRHSNVA
ncbi:hypothetical protein [Azospirillum sp. sgz301742]